MNDPLSVYPDIITPRQVVDWLAEFGQTVENDEPVVRFEAMLAMPKALPEVELIRFRANHRLGGQAGRVDVYCLRHGQTLLLGLDETTPTQMRQHAIDLLPAGTPVEWEGMERGEVMKTVHIAMLIDDPAYHAQCVRNLATRRASFIEAALLERATRQASDQEGASRTRL